MARLLLLLLSFGFGLSAAAQRLPFVMDVRPEGVERYLDAVPVPDSVLGHTVGARHTRPHQLVEYYRAVDAASDRVAVRRHGETYDGRPLVHAVVTSPANHARLEEIRRRNLRLSEEPGAVTGAELASLPVVVYMGYSVHGDEASGSEAALLTLYHLAAGAGPAVERVLDSAVVILDPSFNPDGRARFVEWVNQNRGPVPTVDPEDREHNQPWPGGRTNHYFFDLNRDWLTAQLPESRGRLRLFHDWRPQLFTDFHEMEAEATYFFQPGVPSRNNPNTPPGVLDLTREIARYHARALDRIGSLYFTEESYDDFYYGKGSTYPDVNGAVGILFEQASSRALARETGFGRLDYAFTIRNQFTTSLSTLEAAVALRERLLGHQRDFYREAAGFARSSPVKGYVFGSGADRSRALALVELLLRNRIRVHRLARPLAAEGFTYTPEAAFLVPMDQPQARLVKAVMEETTSFEDSLFYDISTWTLPHAFGVRHAELRASPAAYLGDRVEEIGPAPGRLAGGESAYGYLMEWGPYYAPRALYRLLEAGVRPLLLNRPFEAEVEGRPRAFAPGTVFIPVVGREGGAGPAPERVHALVRLVVREDGVTVSAAGTGLTPSGADLGSRRARVLALPRVAIVAGPGTSAGDVGQAWHLLAERFRMPVSLLDADRVGRADLGRYTTIVLAGNVGAALPAERLREWVEAGGSLIALEGAVRWAVGQGLVDERLREAPADTLRVPYASVDEARGARAISGAIFEARLDRTHPLAYGYEERVALFRASDLFLEPSVAPGANVAVYTDEPLLSGYVPAAKLDSLKGSAALVARRVGRGSVILIPDDPNFRAFWYGTNGLFLNAVFFGRAF